eukprot:TRINITY_DN11302_c0_g1_i1.p1 TRINITY_DN11302_c0_g1~~TRINITY_DN11302_c0_g1_i1.p1  ORF type:complete len:816 (-),score=187.13 TRINITY_DN11302_c0_g1_i1:7-2454(-)
MKLGKRKAPEKPSRESGQVEQESKRQKKDSQSQSNNSNKRKLAFEDQENCSEPPTKKLKPMSNTKTNNLRKSAPVKKLSVRPLASSVEKQNTKNGTNDKELWGKIESAVGAILNKTRCDIGSEEIYKSVEDLILLKHSSDLYTFVQQKLESDLDKKQLEILNYLQGSNGQMQLFSGQSDFLKYMENSWIEFCETLNYIRNVFLKLDRGWANTTSSVRPLWEMGTDIYRTKIMGQNIILQRMLTSLNNTLHIYREGNSISIPLVQTLIRSFITLNIYEKFEEYYLNFVRQYRQEEVLKRFFSSQSTFDISEFLAYVYRVYQFELADISEAVLFGRSKKDIEKILDTEVLTKNYECILQWGFLQLMDLPAETQIQQTRMYYRYFKKNIRKLDSLNAKFGEYIKVFGALIVENTPENEMIGKLIEFYGKINNVWENGFSKNKHFHYQIKGGFEHVLNLKEIKMGELLAKFVDGRLRTGVKMTAEEIEALLDKAIELFKYINGKDVFEAFYRKDLAKRLLLNKTSSVDLERSMISKLKEECGGGYTSKFEGMFKDMDLSRDILEEFKTHAQSVHKNMDLNVSVLTTGNWPPFNQIELKLPESLAEYQELFKQWYGTKYHGRKLFWQNSLGHVILRVNWFGPGNTKKKEFILSLLQNSIMYCFERTGSLNFNEIKQIVGTEEKELKRGLWSLSCGKLRILTKEPKGSEIGEEDVFTWNEKFRHKMYRIPANAIQITETAEENDKVKKEIAQDRQYQIDAAVVRVMKTRKQLAHANLMSELITQCKFPLKNAEVKKRIESLIDRDYLERDKKDPNVYIYLA